MIEVVNLTRRYGDFAAVKDITFKVNKGEILGFLGPNGAGKTTTMRILTGYMPATHGTARVAGYDVFENPLEVKKRVGYLPENPPLYVDMTVASYLDFVAKIKGVDSKNRKARVSEVIGKTALEEKKNSLIGHLSKGFRQRVGIAQALVHEPEILVLDEPTIGLDPGQIIEVRDLIKSLGGAHTVVLSTHILPEVSKTCDRVVIINRGHLVADGGPDILSSQVSQSKSMRVLVAGPVDEVSAELQKIAGVTRVEIEKKDNGSATFRVQSGLQTDSRAQVARVIVQKGWDLLELQAVGVSLEEVFVELTTGDVSGENEED